MSSISRYDLKNSNGITCILIETDALLSVSYRDTYNQMQVSLEVQKQKVIELKLIKFFRMYQFIYLTTLILMGFVMKMTQVLH